MISDKEKSIKVETLRDMISYCPETGDLKWKERYNCGFYGFNAKYAGKRCFTVADRKGHLTGTFLGKTLRSHRVAWSIYYGEWPDGQIDHIDGNPNNNSIKNLRICENDVNCRNKGIYKNNTTGWNGVSFHKGTGRWAAKYRKNYKHKFIGYFNCPTSAGIAVAIAQRKDEFSIRHGT